ncbi:hypothetical protein SLEP1_g12450 [Rubroshorea leprosula]|uniref:PB1-like domain-containing protein n=1 Tax=Rubroshorea leprosula TaxID=152421 RepID=A0AAV5IIL2_9ROSI|nr:hypothetical protein SLEP1_g12450 [Rubroshorea leprosula]
MGEVAPFTICIHYDGQFGVDKSRYTEGETYDLLVFDVNKLCYWDIKDKVTKPGFISFKGLYYKVPNLSMVHGHPLCEVAIGVGKLLLHPEVLGSDANDDELLVGNNKVTNLMGNMDSTDTLSHGRKTNDKGKEKATKACQQWKSERNGGVMASSSSKGIIIKEPEANFEGFQLVDNLDIEYSDIECSSSSTYINSGDAESYDSDSSIKDLNVKDNVLRKVKKYYGTHSCFKTNRNKMVIEPFLVGALWTIVTNSPRMSSRQLVDHVKAELNVEVSKYKCQRAKRIIKNELEATYIEQYKYFRGYEKHMLTTNLGSSCIIGIENSAATTPYQFKRMYFCFDGCKRGWKANCRRIIGLDGSFLKGVCKGILLSAIGRDGNNQMFPMA